MSSHFLGRAFAIASAALLSACQSLSPDGGMSTVAMVAAGGLNKNVVRISSAEDASIAQSRSLAPASCTAERRCCRADRAPQQYRAASRV